MDDPHDKPAAPDEPDRENARLELLYRDEALVAVNKPSGILVHRTRISRDREFVLQRLRNQLGRHVFPAHRLDRATSGVLLFALDPDTASTTATQFQAGQVRKHYIAVVRGYTEPGGRIEHALDSEDSDTRREAVTCYRRLAAVELDAPVGRYPTARYSLVAIRPETGRRHQIRRHFAHISHPVVGDTTHGDGRHNRFFRERFGIHRLLLHAWSLELEHPQNRDALRIQAPLPAEFQGLLGDLGWHLPEKPPEMS